MSFCPVIEIFPSNVDHFITSDSRVILDVDGSTDVSLSEQLKKNDVLITREPLEDLTLSIPNTPRNFYYLKSLFDPATEKPNNHSIVTRITVGSQTLMYNVLYGVIKNKERIELRFAFTDNWIDLLKQTKLSELPLPEIDFILDNILENWNNDKLYIDGDDGYWFPLVHYGGWLVPERRIAVEDLRPFLHATFLLQKMFEHIGWCIESPFYETDFGRSLICYLLKSDYNNNDEFIPQRLFAANKVFVDQTSVPGNLTDWTETLDNGNNFDPVTGIYENAFEGKLILKLKLDSAGLGGFISFRLNVNKTYLPPFFNTQLYSEVILLIQGSEKLIEIPVNLLADEKIIVNINEWLGDAELFTIEYSNEVDRAIYAKGDIIKTKDEVDQDLSCWDVFSGLQHLIYGIVDVDLITKTVKLLTPYNANIFGETITGYFNSTLVDLIATQPIDTAVSILQNVDQLRYILIGFAKSTDPKLKDLKQADGTELLSKLIDLGVIYKRDTEPDKNPLFEGTVTDIVITPYITPDVLYLPIMTDNKDNKISHSIKPRILYAAGFGRQQNTLDQDYAFEFSLQQDVAFAFNDNKGITFNGIALAEKLIYGAEENDLWSLVYGKFYTQLKGRIKLDFLSYLTHDKYFTLDLKKLFQIEYDGHPITGRLISVNDFKPCKVISTQVTLLPEITTDNYCFDSEPQPDICNNQPSIVVMIDGTCYTFSIDGNFDCAIFSITWEKKIGSGAWEAAGSGSTLQLCDINEIFIVRATIVYACDCPDDIRTKTINPCNNNASCFIEQYTNANGEICLQFSYTGNFSSDYTVTVELNGTPIDDPYLFCGAESNTDYEFVATFVFDNDCEDLVLTCSTNTGEAICNNNPILICVPITVNGVTCMTWTIGGSQTSEVVVFFVNWECSNGTSGVWMPGDDPVCCSGTITAFAMVHYCDCEPVCTPTIQCDIGGCTIVSAGSAIQLIACN